MGTTGADKVGARGGERVDSGQGRAGLEEGRRKGKGGRGEEHISRSGRPWFGALAGVTECPLTLCHHPL